MSRRSLLASGAVFAGFWSLVASIVIRRPLILPDEAGFILNALQIVDQRPSSGLNYYPGYSVFLVPVIRTSGTLSQLMFGVQVVNALFAATTFVLLYRLASALAPDLSDKMRAAVSLLVTLYPAYRLFGALALSENLLIPLGLAVVLGILRQARKPSFWIAVLLGASAGGSFFVHARAIALPAALIVWAVWARPKWWPVVVGATMVALGAAAAGVSALVDAESFATTDSDARDTLSGIFVGLVDLRAIVTLPLTGLGSLFYLVAASFGILLIGAVAVVMDLDLDRSRDSDRSPREIIAPYLAAVMLFSLCLSSLFLNQTTGDQAIYGRYMEGIAAPILLTGLLRAVEHRDQVMAWAGRSVLFLGASAFTLVLLRGPGTFDGRQQLLNITGVFPVVDVDGAIRLSSLFAVGACAATLVSLALRKNAAFGLALMALAFVSTTAWNAQVANAATDVLGKQDGLVQAARILADAEVSCIALDQAELGDRWHQENVRLNARTMAFELWNSGGQAAPCSPFVVSSRVDLSDDWPGASLVLIEPYVGFGLWSLDGRAPENADGVTWIDVPEPDAELPADQEVVIEVTAGPSEGDAVRPGSLVTGVIRIENRGPMTLLPTDSFASDVGMFALGLEWRSSDALDTRRHEPSRVHLESALEPGESRELEFSVSAAGGGVLTPGDYQLRVELVQEGIFWTDHYGAVDISVVPEEDDS